MKLFLCLIALSLFTTTLNAQTTLTKKEILAKKAQEPLPSKTTNSNTIPGDEFKPALIPGDQFKPKLIPGDQFKSKNSSPKRK